MAIARKPNSPNHSVNPVVDVEALIAKGGSVGNEMPLKDDNTAKSPEKRILSRNSDTERETCAFTFRIPTALLSELDEHRKSKPYKVTRQQWLLAAVVQQLAREASNDDTGSEE